MTGARLVAGHLERRGWLRADVDDAVVTLWTLNSVEVRSVLARRGFDDDRISRVADGHAPGQRASGRTPRHGLFDPEKGEIRSR